MRKILITGGAGFVGRRFVRHFLGEGDEVHVVDAIAPFTGGIDPAAGWPIFEPRDFVNFRFLKQDCRRFFETHDDMDFDYVFHLAAIVGGRTVIENNPLAIAADLSIDAAYWQWAQRVHPRKTVLSDILRIPGRCEATLVPSGVLSNGKSCAACTAGGQSRQLTAPTR